MKKALIVVGLLLFIGGAAFAYKTGLTISKVTTNANIFGSISNSLPLVKKKLLKGEQVNRINVAIIGMRGAKVTGGGLLADTIMVMSYQPDTNKVAMVSLPRDLAVRSDGERINKIYFDGEQAGAGGGIEAMRAVLSEVTGQDIHYMTVINFAGFTQLIDALGGVRVNLAQKFIEPMQFKEEKVCDGANGGVFTVLSGNTQKKIDYRGKIVAEYPLCFNKTNECGGVFVVPAGESTLDGENALCYVRARVTSSDFDRARRQQEILQALQQKMLSVGTLTSFSKINKLMDALGNNLRTDMQLWEMQRFFELYSDKGLPKIVTNQVLDNSPDGFLYLPEGAGENGRAYILRPRGGNYDRIHELFRGILIPGLSQEKMLGREQEAAQDLLIQE